MPEISIGNYTVRFPFEPYPLQRAYMAKVLECLENGTNGVLESPTGTGKTLCLLCSTLAWVVKQKLDFKANVQKLDAQMMQPDAKPSARSWTDGGADGPDGETNAAGSWTPKVIYASRTHSQLTQAMQELKRSAYSGVRAAVIGSRDQLCIHPDVTQETNNSSKIHMCKLKITTRSCSFHHRVESSKSAPQFTQESVMDIEDLVAAGRKLKCCPYFVSRELIEGADIVFMPYNYLLDPKARKANKIELANAVIILDEAHNVERICEDSASVQLASSEVATCIDDATHIINAMEKDKTIGEGFTQDDVVLLKEMLLSLEQAIDDIVVKDADKGQTFDGAYMFEFLAQANITDENQAVVTALLDGLIQFLTTVAEQNSAFRRGGGFQKVQDLLTIVFNSGTADYKQRVTRCYKVHVVIEQPNKDAKGGDSWQQPKVKQSMLKKKPKIISYWCFSPGFGMQQLLGKKTRSVILTSGTLAPLKPLITELDIPISVRLENPHIVTEKQVCVKIVTHGPDKEMLLSNYENRNNPKYITSLGRTVLAFCPVVPHGLLIFFTSYFMLNQCRDSWQASGIWSQIKRHKPIYIEPKQKDAFVPTMNEYYASIDDPQTRGAIFMAVCRGKVSEGLDFANANGRAVIITGLPFPPLMDHRVVLKKKYLQDNRTRENEMLSGDEWYFLEATRAVNQAIGRVIRHKDDYGAILLCDSRFVQQRQISHLSSWIQGHLQAGVRTENFGPLIGSVSRFFRNAERTLPDMGKLKAMSADEVSETPAFRSTQVMVDGQPTSGTIAYRFGNNAESARSASYTPASNASDPFEAYRNIPRPAMASANVSSTDAFFDGLDRPVSVISFESSASASSASVSIHKRVNTSPLFEQHSSVSATQQGLKKRRLRLVPNEPSPVAAPLKTGAGAASSETLPSDRSQLLKLLKSSLAPNKYAQFVSTLTAYQRESDVQQLVVKFADIFDEPQFHYLFRGMRRFVRESQKERFDADVERLL